MYLPMCITMFLQKHRCQGLLGHSLQTSCILIINFEGRGFVWVHLEVAKKSAILEGMLETRMGPGAGMDDLDASETL